MDTTKLIIGIFVVVFFIVKTILADAKKERDQKKTSPHPKAPKTVFPSFFYEDEPKKEEPCREPVPTFMQEGQSVTMPTPTPPMTAETEMSEEEQQAHAERWRRAVIDSEILKTKF